MPKSTKANQKIQVKPYFQWAVSDHLFQQAERKGITKIEILALTSGEVELTKVRKHDDKCKTCNRFKFDYFSKEAPKSGKDLKIVGCESCGLFITTYLNERTHGNTAVHSYQKEQGVIGFLGQAHHCGYRPYITADMTQEEINDLAKHDCHQWRQNGRRF